MIYQKKTRLFVNLNLLNPSSLQREERRDRSILDMDFWTDWLGIQGIHKSRGNSVPTKWSTSQSFSFVCLVGDIFMDSNNGDNYVSLREGTNILSFLLHFGAILMDSTMVSSSIFPASHPGSWFRRKVHLQLNSPT